MSVLLPTRWVLLMLMALVLSACSTTSGLPESQVRAIEQCKSQLPAAQRLKLESVSMGCMASMALSKVTGSNNPAPLLCMAGGASGLLFGESIAERKCSYVTKEAQLSGEIAHAKKMNTGFATVFAQEATALAEAEVAVAALKAQQAKAQVDQMQLGAAEKLLTNQINNDQAILAKVQEEIGFKQQTLLASTQINQKAETDSLKLELELLNKNVKTLRVQVAKWQKLKQELPTFRV